MNYNRYERNFLSADGKNTVYAEIYTPRSRSAHAVVQISHGMVDHVGRYLALIDYLTGEGFVVAGNHHLGHGKTASCEEDFGFFADKGGTELLIEDLHSFNRILREEFPTLPLIMLGHSMGSFLARLYATKYPHTLKGLIIHGTSGSNAAVGAGRVVASIIMLLRGRRYRSGLLTSLSIGAYSKRFGSEGKNAWLTRRAEYVADRETDPYARFRFTASAYRDLFGMLSSSNKKEWYKSFPRGLATLVISGEEDPVGAFGKGPRQVYKRLLVAGCEDVTLKMYGGARHELFNEENREEVFHDLATWIRSVANKTKFTF